MPYLQEGQNRHQLREGTMTIGLDTAGKIVTEGAAMQAYLVNVTLHGRTCQVAGLSRGATIDGQPLMEGIATLKEGNRIQIGDLTFTFHEGNDQPPPIELEVHTMDEGRIMGRAEAPENALVDHRALVGMRQGLSTMELTEFFQATLEDLVQRYQADRGFVLLRGEGGAGQGEVRVASHYIAPAARADDLRISRTLAEWVLTRNTAILYDDARKQAPVQSQSLTESGIRSMIAVPIPHAARGKPPIGVLQLDTMSVKNAFKPRDLPTIMSTGVLLSVAIEISDLLENKRAAKAMQLITVPEVPSSPYLSFGICYLPTKNLGGDFCDIVELGNGRVALVVGDISGKGAKAAEDAVKIWKATRDRLQRGLPPGAVLTGLNRDVIRFDETSEHFATMGISVIDQQSGKVTSAYAGHQPLWIRRKDGGVEEASSDVGGLPIGIDDRNYTYREGGVLLQPGEMITNMTDGVMEAQGKEGALFGRSGVENLLGRSAGSPQEFVDTLSATVAAHSQGQQTDDICIIACRLERLEKAPAAP